MAKVTPNKVEGQDTPTRSPEQRGRYAPWVVLGAWILIALGSGIIRPTLDPNEASGLLTGLGIGANAAGLAGWATVWLILSSNATWLRLAYFLIGTAGLFAAMFLGLNKAEYDLFAEFAKLIVGVVVVLSIMRCWGWRITANQARSREHGGDYGRVWQFSILELLILTTEAAIFTGILLLNGSEGILEDFGTTSLFVLTVVATTIVAFVIRPTLLVASIFLTAIFVATALPYIFPLGFLACVMGLSLLMAALPLRLCGYRFARSN